ncbi:MFS general substrate transporter [Aspergillus costaricaensis CBS 115574]|uniref:MFS general substrate transporter n=1 Tax=Aspergillus costaricaensis CBS 115574 TaxID=1448317 RepID=A0ACD1IMK4_9EURO|nr:MFS general substrate transporter [Aspergillus costaricaensis CBS 115574]RAK91631.1 MFS general substrate transporter [Aspergillus costaricaensis CBS 115574]
MDTGIIGPVTVMNSFVSQFGSQSSTVHGLIVISIGALIFAIGATLEAAAVHIGIYICEISPPRVRGALTTGLQLLVTLGLTIGFFTCYGTSRMKSSYSWRTPFIILACLATTFSVASLLWLNLSPRCQAEHEKAEIEQTQGVPPASSDKHAPSASHRQDRLVDHKFSDLFSKNVRTRTFWRCFSWACSNSAELMYAPLLFEKAGLDSSDASFFASGVSAIVIFAVTIPALIWADRWGRRRSSIYGGIGLAVTMFLIGGLYAGNAVYNSTGAGRWSYTLSRAVGIKIYAAEIQPQRTRASATSLAHGSNWAANFLVALTTPILLSKNSFGAYFLFGGCTLITAFICALFMPETKGQSLDEIEEAFRSKLLSKTLLKAFGPITQTAQG